MTFFYWLPFDRQPTSSAAIIEAMKRNGLAYALDDRPTHRTVDSGPDGRRGVVVRNGENKDGRLGYFTDVQTWRRVPSIDAWCGMFKDDRPTPDDLARKEMVAGDWVRFDDDSSWLVPKARKWFELDGQLRWINNLPQCLTLNDEGQWVQGGIKAKFKRLWDLAVAYEETADADGKYLFTVEQLNEMAVATLQVNYRIGSTELDMLGVYDESIRGRIIDVLLDVTTLVEWSKKNEAARDGGTS